LLAGHLAVAGRTLKGIRALALTLTVTAFATPLAVAGDWPRYGVDLAPSSLRYGFLSTASLKFEPLPSRASWFDAVQREVEADAAVTKPVWHHRLRLPAGQALVLRYRWTLSLSRASYDVAATQFAVLLPSSAYMLVYWTTPQQDTSYRPIFERSAGTLRIAG
jgi:hypothetical protein